jgi:hypothetical protein
MTCACDYEDGKVTGLCGAHSAAMREIINQRLAYAEQERTKALRELRALWQRRAKGDKSLGFDGGAWLLCATELETEANLASVSK